MSNSSKVRVQLLDEATGGVLEEVDVLTSADAVTFADGQTFQQKLDAGLLKGPKGDTGAQGVQGIQGPKGDTGNTGAKGADGKTWYTSTTLPATSLGAIGDMYLNTSTFDVSEKTGTSTWTVRGNIKGATGSTGPKGDKGDTGSQGPKGDTGTAGLNGTDGKTWHITSAVPANSLGAVGDMHLNTATYDIREKTGATAWTLRGNIRGATGAKGDKGDKGDTGARGEDGDSVKFGTTFATATDVRLFLKKV